jgi:hypothetical protein
MIPVSLKTVFARVISAFDQRDRGQGYVLTGGVPTAFGAGSLRIDISECIHVTNTGAPERQAATNVTPGPASATLTRADLIYAAPGGGIGLAVGVGVIPSATVPVIPPVIPAGATPLAIAYIGPGAVDYTDPTKAYIHDLRPFAVGPTMENVVLNSDFARWLPLTPHTVATVPARLSMPVVFADTNGYLAVSGVPTVAANILTQNAANNEMLYPKSNPGNFWRDGRVSATFKAVDAAGNYTLMWHKADAINRVRVWMNAGTLRLSKMIAGVESDVGTVVQALTVNRWYWLETESQGTTFIAKIYDTGGTVPGVPKSSSALLQTIVGTIGDAGVQAGDMEISASPAAAQWGGIAASPGGIYVEAPLPESWPITFSGALDGQAVGIEEGAGVGPLGLERAMRAYIPHASRAITLNQYAHTGAAGVLTTIKPSTMYTASGYMKVSGKGGAGILSDIEMYDYDRTFGVPHNIGTIADLGEVVWTRKTGSAVTNAASNVHRTVVQINPGLTATGTAYFMLPQLEQGPVATAWRNNPSDFAPIVWDLFANHGVAITTTSGTAVEADSRDLAGNFYFPWDATVVVEFGGSWRNSGLNSNLAQASGSLGTLSDRMAAVDSLQPFHYSHRKTYAAGKNRIAAFWAVTAGTGTIDATNFPSFLRVTAYRGK